MEAVIREKFIALAPVMDERTRRLWAATEAKALGHGGPTLVARATGLSRSTLYLGLRELEHGARRPVAEGHGVRRPGGGRKALTGHAPTLVTAPGSPGGADQPRRPAVSLAMDVQECAAISRRVASARPPSGPPNGRSPACRLGV
jgi:hypothetical protein